MKCETSRMENEEVSVRKKATGGHLEIVRPDAARDRCGRIGAISLGGFGLLSNSFQPTDEIRIARTLWRRRANLLAEAGSAIRSMQKVFGGDERGLANVLSDNQRCERHEDHQRYVGRRAWSAVLAALVQSE